MNTIIDTPNGKKAVRIYDRAGTQDRYTILVISDGVRGVYGEMIYPMYGASHDPYTGIGGYVGDYNSRTTGSKCLGKRIYDLQSLSEKVRQYITEIAM